MQSNIKNQVIDGLKGRSLGYLEQQYSQWVHSLIMRISVYQFAFKDKRPRHILEVKMMMVVDAIEWLEILEDVISDLKRERGV